VDFALSDATGAVPVLTQLIECKLSDTKPHIALKRFATEQPNAVAVQVVRDLRHEEDIQGLHTKCCNVAQPAKRAVISLVAVAKLQFF
jgi:hypothetical protein